MNKRFVGNHPWVLMGDFNAGLFLEDSTAGTTSYSIALREFKECVDELCVSDINHSGLRYTWNQRPNVTSGLLKKIDRVMANDVFTDSFTNAFAMFHPYRIPNHAPLLFYPFPWSRFTRIKHLSLATILLNMKIFFKLFGRGGKLRSLKSPIRKLMWQKVDLHKRVLSCRQALDDAHVNIDQNPFEMNDREQVQLALKEYNEVILEEESFLKQKSKIEWLRVGDSNSSFFHKVVKG
ncbi:uncharacterized protein [Rutidosis leptorrhynchoides]|uniref:uncharacterized protein n=1 Tax=Rutidosis leptorrhynchoides TaxID=125765 RepID=UPI003A990113